MDFVMNLDFRSNPPRGMKIDSRVGWTMCFYDGIHSGTLAADNSRPTNKLPMHVKSRMTSPRDDIKNKEARRRSPTLDCRIRYSTMVVGYHSVTTITNVLPKTMDLWKLMERKMRNKS
jgi:hypothetical protein